MCWRTQCDPFICCVTCALQPMIRWLLLLLPADLVRGLLLAARSAIKKKAVLLQTLGLPTELFQIVLAKTAQQHGTASSLRLTCRSMALGCAAALVTGETARQALIYPQANVQCCFEYPSIRVS